MRRIINIPNMEQERPRHEEDQDLMKIVDDGIAQDVKKEKVYNRMRHICEAAQEGNLTLSNNKLRDAQELIGFLISSNGIDLDRTRGT